MKLLGQIWNIFGDYFFYHFSVCCFGLVTKLDFVFGHVLFLKFISTLLVLLTDNLLDELEFMIDLVICIHFNPMPVESRHKLSVADLATLISVEIVE